MNSPDFSRRTRHRPPAAWHRYLGNRLAVLLTSLGLAPRGGVTLEVPIRRSARVERARMKPISEGGPK